MATTATKTRRTQEERRHATRTALLDATIACLGEFGYAGTSISTIIDKAGVSRGALLHHYPSKNELIAHAIVHFYRQRLARFKEKLLGADTTRLSLEDRLRVLKEDFETWYHTALEIEVAMRTNEEVARLEQSFSALDREDMSREYELLFPEFAATDSPRELVGIACYLMKGIAGSDNPERTARQFDISVSLIRSYLETLKS